MTKEKIRELTALYTIEKIREGHGIAGSEVFRHSAAIKLYESDNRQKLLESNRSSAYVARQLGFTTRYIEILRKKMRDRKK